MTDESRKADSTDSGNGVMDCVAGGGEMGERIRAMDWSQTPLGPIVEWPQSLRTAISICLNSRFPILAWWGPELRMLYNDGYRDLIAGKHPTALGQPGCECWAEIWDTISPMLDQVMTEGVGTWSDDLQLFLHRNGYPEECYFTFSYSPIRDETGRVVGVFTPVQETTAYVIGARRLRTPISPSARAREPQTVREAAVAVMDNLAANPWDVPFALLYLVDDVEHEAALAATAGIAPGAVAAPLRVPLHGPTAAPWPLADALATRAPVEMLDLDTEALALPRGAWDAPPTGAVVLPLSPRGEAFNGILVCAVSPHTRLDTDYRDFLHRIAAQVGSALSAAAAREEEQRLLRSLELQRSHLADLFEQAPVILAVLRGPQHIFEAANPRYLQLVGRDGIIGKPVAQALPEVVDQGFVAILDQVFTQGEAYHGSEVSVWLRPSPDAPLEENFVTFIYEPLVEEDGSISGILVAGMDVSESVRVRGELLRKTEALAAADRAKDEFLAMLGHELRNPLGAISNAVYLLRARFPDLPGIEKPVDTLTRQTEHLNRLVDDLLDVSRITQGKITLQRRPLALTPLVSAAMSSLRPHGDHKGLKWVLESQGDPWVFADPLRLEQIVSNLLTNALKYTEAGEIRVSVSLEDDEAVVRVRDTGIGIAPDMLPRVFDLFAQADAALDRTRGGLGIGLTLVRRLTEMHGGRAAAASEGIGRGSTFSIALAATEPAPDTRANQNAPSPVEADRRVLVVDDNADAAEILADVMAAWGVTADVAYDGPGGIQKAAEFRPDTVLLDIGLPGLDGYEVARLLRDTPHGQTAHLIALTGYGQPGDRQRAEAAGFDHHLTKPVNLDALKSLLFDDNEA